MGRRIQPTASWSNTRFLVTVFCVAVSGVAIRVINVLAQWDVDLSQGDPGYYYLQGGLLADGRWFIDPFLYAYTGAIEASASHPPLFTMTIAAADLLGIDSVNTTRLLLCLIGGLGVLMVGLLGRELGSNRVGLLASGVAAIYPVFWLTDGLILSEVLYMPLVAGLLLVSYRLWKRPRTALAVALGVIGGLAGLTRSEGLVALLLIAASVLLLAPGLSVRRRAALLGASLLAAGVTVGPWIGFNATRFNQPVYMSTNGGATVADTNCAAAYEGSQMGGWVFGCHPTKAPQGGDESDRSAFDLSVGAAYAREHWTRLPVVVLARVGRIWGVVQPIQTIDNDAFGKWSRGASQAMLLGYWIAAGLGLAGAVVLRRRGITLVPLLAAVVAVTVTAAAFYGLIRFRVPGDIVLVVLSAVALDALVDRVGPSTTRSSSSPTAQPR